MDPTINGSDSVIGQEAQSEKVVINGAEYDVTTAQELIGLGQKTREYEQKWNTSLDKVWPEYGKTTQTLKQFQTENEQLKQQIAQFQQKQVAGIETPTDIRQAQEAARKLGIVLNEDLSNQGYIKRDELEKYLEQREREKQAVETVIQTGDRLEKEIDGTDGRPKFSKKVVMAYASAYGIPDLMKAYEDMHSSDLETWKKTQLESKQTPGLKTLKGGATAKAPKPVAIDDSNFDSALKEALWGSKE